MLDGIISGGKSGAEQAARQAAIAYGIPTGGWMSEGSGTARGPGSELAQPHGAEEMRQESRPTPTEQNVRGSDATLWFGDTTTADAQTTVAACHRFGRPCMPVYPAATFEPSHVATWITENQIKMLNVAGNREDEEPGISAGVQRFLCELLLNLGHNRT
jgi:hypothetical protein